MNCRDAEPLILVERDGALDTSQRAALAAHVARCPACRAMQEELTHAVAAWRQRSAAVPVPAVEQEWHAIRRRLRGAHEPVISEMRWKRPAWWSVTAAAAVIVIAALLGPSWFGTTAPESERDWAYVSYVEVQNPTDSTMVYEDPQSGWLVVWVGDAPAVAGS